MTAPANFQFSIFNFHFNKWYEASEYSLLTICAIALPIQWRIALWCLVLLCINTLIKIIATRRIFNPALNRPIRSCLYLMVIYYLLYAVSCIYSSQPTAAASTISTMLPLLLFPLVFLLGDTSYLHRRHLSSITFLFAATLTLRFVIMLLRSVLHSADSQLYTSTTGAFASILVWASSLFAHASPLPCAHDALALLPIRAVAHLFHNTPFEHLPPYQFDPLHHNYLSLYILTAIALLYTETVHHWQSPRWRKTRWFIVADIAFLSAYILLSDSRSGIVAWVLLASACLIHIATKLRQWRPIAIILATATILIGLTYWATPKTYKRITDTAQNLLSGQRGDVRQSLWQSGLEAVKERPLFGYGCDGYWDALFAQYRAHDCLDANIKKFSTHNQYLETTLATGVVGLMVMLAMILLPVLLAFRRPHRNLPMFLFTVVYATCIFFEAAFGRQMGLLFIGFGYCLLLLYSSPTCTPKKGLIKN